MERFSHIREYFIPTERVLALIRIFVLPTKILSFAKKIIQTVLGTRGIDLLKNAVFDRNDHFQPGMDKYTY